MSGHLPVISGEELLRVLERRGFVRMRQRGSHVFLVRRNGGVATALVPLHRELDRGTLRAILRGVGMSPDDLRAAL